MYAKVYSAVSLEVMMISARLLRPCPTTANANASHHWNASWAKHQSRVKSRITYLQGSRLTTHSRLIAVLGSCMVISTNLITVFSN